MGRSSFSVDAGEWLHYGMPTWGSAALSVLLTTSGESTELVRLMREGKSIPQVLMCNNLTSTCWQESKFLLPILAGPEYGNATKSYTNATAASIILASELLGVQWEKDAEAAFQVFSVNLEEAFAQRSELETFCRGASNLEIIGRGASYGAAIMGALCIREMSGFRAAAHTGAGFRHGPNLDVDGTHVAMIFAIGRVAELGVQLAEECNRRGGKVVLVSTQEHDRTESLYPVRLESVREPWEGISSIVVPQALTLGMIERSGCRLPPRFEYGVMHE
jgi:glucosamine--fructose-6-phosphate aminotransferase (isomerizing)